MTTTIDRPTLPRFWDYSGLAELLGVEESWLRNNIRHLPHSKIGGKVRFTESDVARIFDLYHVEPDVEQPAPAEPVAPVAVVTGPHPLADVVKPRRARKRA